MAGCGLLTLWRYANNCYVVASLLIFIAILFSTPNYIHSRVFYETLLHQRPDSIMAQEWCVVYGVLEGKEAVKAHQQMLKRKGKSVSGGSASASSPKKEKAKKKSKKSSRILDDNVEFDAGMDAGGDEGIGMATL